MVDPANFNKASSNFISHQQNDIKFIAILFKLETLNTYIVVT